MEFIRRKLLVFVLKGLFKAITVDQLLFRSGKKLFLGSKELPLSEKRGIIEEAKMLCRSEVLRIVFDEVRMLSYKNGVESSSNMDAVIANKIALHVIHTIEEVLKELGSIPQDR